MKNISDKCCRETRNAHFAFNNFFFPVNLGVFELMWQNVVVRGRPRMVIWRMRIACWMFKTTNAYTGCVILIPFSLQQWLHERTVRTLPVVLRVKSEVNMGGRGPFSCWVEYRYVTVQR